MNIFFSGIGGVGIGPLAEIASDAGYEIQGSDLKESPLTHELQARGIPLSLKQDGSFLAFRHNIRPVDWFVYTAALPADHPELLQAKKLGIKTAKRDELLARIIKDKNLKLIAIAGTHGKTTTTGMLIWCMQQSGIPVSYSVGTTLSFGPSGAFNPSSEFFIYECDEFDRNFLHFFPYLSVLTAIDYDHPDTYPSEVSYQAAFDQFIRQSDMTIMWKTDNISPPPEKSWTLSPNEVMNIRLPGAHNRRNASLTIKAMEFLKLGNNADTIKLMETFPGTDRRFEKLADNLYTDYGHHPVEIAATLELASELSDHIVLVYQPHQNIRQHEIRHDYIDCFERAEQVYWLPTYLSREDPTLAVLAPQDITTYVTNKSIIEYSELGDSLWESIEEARRESKLVLCMGAGTIDAWVRTKLAMSPLES